MFSREDGKIKLKLALPMPEWLTRLIFGHEKALAIKRHGFLRRGWRNKNAWLSANMEVTHVPKVKK